MKRILIAALLIVGIIPLTGNAATTTLSGTLQVGTLVPGGPGIVEAFAPCDPADSLNGTDGVWIPIDGHAGETAILEGNPFADFDVRFYSVECALIDYSDMQVESWGEPEVGIVPGDAAFMMVALYLGQNATFTMTLH